MSKSAKKPLTASAPAAVPSLLPGNGILRAETKGPKRLRKFRDAVAETKLR